MGDERAIESCKHDEATRACPPSRAHPDVLRDRAGEARVRGADRVLVHREAPEPGAEQVRERVLRALLPRRLRLDRLDLISPPPDVVQQQGGHHAEEDEDGDPAAPPAGHAALVVGARHGAAPAVTPRQPPLRGAVASHD